MVYGADVMLLVEIKMSTWHRENFLEEGKLFIFTDLLFLVDKKSAQPYYYVTHDNLYHVESE